MTRTGRNRTANNPRENLMATESLLSQGEMGRDGLSKVGLTCVNPDVLLSCARKGKERGVFGHEVSQV